MQIHNFERLILERLNYFKYFYLKKKRNFKRLLSHELNDK